MVDEYTFQNEIFRASPIFIFLTYNVKAKFITSFTNGVEDKKREKKGKLK